MAGAMKLWYTEFKKKQGRWVQRPGIEDMCLFLLVFMLLPAYLFLWSYLGLFVSCLRMRMYLLGRRIFLMQGSFTLAYRF